MRGMIGSDDWRKSGGSVKNNGEVGFTLSFHSGRTEEEEKDRIDARDTQIDDTIRRQEPRGSRRGSVERKPRISG
jgi:hypothetical protein